MQSRYTRRALAALAVASCAVLATSCSSSSKSSASGGEASSPAPTSSERQSVEMGAPVKFGDVTMTVANAKVASHDGKPMVMADVTFTNTGKGEAKTPDAPGILCDSSTVPAAFYGSSTYKQVEPLAAGQTVTYTIDLAWPDNSDTDPASPRPISCSTASVHSNAPEGARVAPGSTATWTLPPAVVSKASEGLTK